MFSVSNVDHQWENGINTLMEFCHVHVDVILHNVAVLLTDVINQIPDGHIIECYIEVIKLSIGSRRQIQWHLP